ncbi:MULTISPECIES: PQQ-binding-like beta-propeller repeat protein [unclassified Lentimicrobium]|uniref:outer membrane protein assembly factor BamB family protein n=1 Tax=unclassified Lentimicrobium TaxID=2677434 RepID=UPI001554A2A2|nr:MULTISPECIES: PQQ-binding-like beta-propeller repeat protein [unclassified Lentimicrobium]NPD47674.1 PQQ-binding-like beta-propeller repeat protein [Lentimicrobium sp. S6]NPD86972.1 PQQ-binding-like beta-propeller repeat protein [Lentimicrobium sp. L6]
MKRVIFVFTLSLLIGGLIAQEVAQWRGPNRDGKYPDKGLMKIWPETGPEMLWHYDDLGLGHGSAAVTSDRVFTSGTDEDGNGFVVALNHSGEKIWQASIGKEWMDNFEGTRSTPLIHGDKLYIMSSYGYLACMNTEDGEIVWDTDLFNDYDGINIKWGVTENLLIDGEKLFVTPGGVKDNILALHKDTGELIWSSKGNSEISAYCSPIVIDRGATRLLITQTAESILGLDANSGEVLWTFEHPNKYSVQANAPTYQDGKVYIVSGYGKGGVQLQISEDGKSVTELWRNTTLDDRMGGVVLVDGRIYGSGDKKSWHCLDWETGEELYKSRMFKNGNIIYADGLLYCYSEAGTVGIVDPKSNDYSLVSTFDVPYGEKWHWAHLVIYDKKLYVRHDHSLMVYDIAEK